MLGSTDRGNIVGYEPGRQVLEASGVEEAIGIEEPDPVSAGLGDTDVSRSRRAAVRYPDRGEVLLSRMVVMVPTLQAALQNSLGAVRRSVIDDNDLDGRIRLASYRVDASAQSFRGIVSCHHHRDQGRLGLRHDQRVRLRL